MKTCSRCGFVGNAVLFTSGKNICKSCRNKEKREYTAKHPGHGYEAKKRWRANNRDRIKGDYAKSPQSFMLSRARQRAKQRGLEFNIGVDDVNVNVPEFCPVLGIRLQVGASVVTNSSPSLDRIDPARGYVKDNVWVISHRANTIKNDATVEELEAVVAALKRLKD